MFKRLKPAPAIARLPKEKVDAEYKKLRWQVFLGIFLGYAGYYLVRKNLSLAIPEITKEHPDLSLTMLGSAGTALSIAYGCSKFIMGSVSDRSNPRYFLPLGLLLSAFLTFLMGIKSLYTVLPLVILIQACNGWVQGMGWPPCGKTMVHWFSVKERGMKMSIWNVAHNIGGAGVGFFAVVGMALFAGDWSSIFWVNSFAAAVIALIAFFLIRDRPVTCGLPPIEEYKEEYNDEIKKSDKEIFSFKEIFFEHVLNNKYLWCIALANAFVYFVRYGIVDWIPTYLQTVKGFDFSQAARAYRIFEWTAIPGTILCGWSSDTLFKGKRAPATITFMTLTMLGVILYWLNQHGPLWIDYVAIASIGFFVYGPVMIIGLHALDIVPKQAAGTAAGFTGFFGYVFGSAIAGTGVGWIADNYSWNMVYMVMIVCCIMSIFFSALTLLKPRKS